MKLAFFIRTCYFPGTTKRPAIVRAFSQSTAESCSVEFNDSNGRTNLDSHLQAAKSLASMCNLINKEPYAYCECGGKPGFLFVF
jgi:hypothetical protein